MPGRVEEDPERVRLRLNLGLACTEGDHRRFADVEVVDIEVEMGLLRMIGAGPVGG